MIRRLLRSESGYSLVEVMVSIMILAIAIIPMVSMFDMGLRTATTGSNYDKARAFANEQLERTKTLSYVQVRDSFPVTGSAPKTPADTPPGTGNYTYSTTVPPSAGLPSGATYTVVKQYVFVDTSVTPADLKNANADSKMMRVNVTVNWSSNSISVSGVVAGGAA